MSDNFRTVINALRSGGVLIINCPNPDPETKDQQESVEVCAEWTGWKDKRYFGATLDAALLMALMDAPKEIQWLGTNRTVRW